MHVSNAGLVASAAGLQMGTSPARIWWRTLPIDLDTHVALTLLSAVAVEVGRISPILLPALIVPEVLVNRAVAQSVRLREETHEALAALVDVVELRDPYTAGHSLRVARTARMLAHRLGLTAEEADLIESAGRVHDIGKVALDPAILTKTTRLTASEWAHMRQHPVLGADVIARFAAYREGVSIIRHHHESWDGTGYPDSISGRDIPLGARILAVADTFDALTSDRPYRKGMTVAEARQILEAGAGKQWDPSVVDAMLAMLDDAPGDIPVFRRGEVAQAAIVEAA
jgi:putative nucleotidyltransferase with HDIG domain